MSFVNNKGRIWGVKVFFSGVLVALFFMLVVSPALAEEVPEQGPFNLIVCGETANDECGFYHLVELGKNIINALIVLSTLIATIAFAYVGVILITSGGNESAKNKAKDILKKVLIGYLWILGAWLLVYTITSALLNDDYNFILGDPQ